MKAIDRVMQIIDYKGVSNSSFEKENDLSNGYIATQLKRNADLGEGVLVKILNNSRNINPEWLLTGNGPMIKEVALPVAVPSGNSVEGIPLIPLDAMAGVASGEVSVMELDCERYIIPVFKGADFLITVKGSSMYPKYSSGDIVACKKLPLNDIFFQWNKVYVLDTIQGALIKRVNKAKKEGYVTIVSENIKYEPFELKINQINAVALVMGVIRLE